MCYCSFSNGTNEQKAWRTKQKKANAKSQLWDALHARKSFVKKVRLRAMTCIEWGNINGSIGH